MTCMVCGRTRSLCRCQERAAQMRAASRCGATRTPVWPAFVIAVAVLVVLAVSQMGCSTYTPLRVRANQSTVDTVLRDAQRYYDWRFSVGAITTAQYTAASINVRDVEFDLTGTAK